VHVPVSVQFSSSWRATLNHVPPVAVEGAAIWCRPGALTLCATTTTTTLGVVAASHHVVALPERERDGVSWIDLGAPTAP
jgi:hypothetical protein